VLEKIVQGIIEDYIRKMARYLLDLAQPCTRHSKVNGKLLASYVSIDKKLRYSRSVVRWQGSKLQQGLFFVSIKSRNLEIFARA